MDEPRVGRRQLLAVAGTGIAGAIAGCSAPRSKRSIKGNSSGEAQIDSENLADESAYTQVYSSIIDSIAQIRAFGVESPISEEDGQGQGTGFLVDLESSGEYVVTNEHVVSGADDIDVQYTGGDWPAARVVGTDYYSDLAALEVDHVPEEAVPLPLSERPPVPGQQVLTVGTPYGLEGTTSQGIVSGVNRSLAAPDRDFSFPNVVQTDAAVNPGNSGGPLVDLDGEAVGVINSGGGENIGFAISAALARRVVPALVEDGTYEHSHLGIRHGSVTRSVAEENGLDEATGIIVTTVPTGGPADGILQGSSNVGYQSGNSVPVGGDVIREIDGEPIPDRHALGTHLALETSPGDEIEIGIWRTGRETTVSVTLGSRSEFV